jgi:hypothetical protein
MAGLNISSGTGTQDTTRSLQASVGAPPGTATGNVQTVGAANSLQTGQSGLQLHGTALTTVSMTNNVATIQQPQPQITTSSSHHINPILAGGSGVLFVLAIMLFWFTFRTAKNTTDN